MIVELQPNSEQYEAFQYPGGESQARLMGDTIARLRRLAEGRAEVDLVARIHNAQELIETCLLADAIDGVDQRLRIHLWAPYLPYARADRRFSDGDCFGLRVFAEIVNAMSFASVITHDVHSEEARRIDDLLVVEPTEYIERSIVDFALKQKVAAVTALLPDEGAAKRYTIRPQLGCNIRSVAVKTVTATKKRDSLTGKLSGFDVPKLEGPTIIIDDICDGGGTFLGIAQKAGGVPLALYTTHAIYSKGTESLLAYFEHLYCTDSYSKRTVEVGVTQYPIRIGG